MFCVKLSFLLALLTGTRCVDLPCAFDSFYWPFLGWSRTAVCSDFNIISRDQTERIHKYQLGIRG